MAKIALAFSGGLDTSFCVAYLIEQGFEVATVTVNTGGFTATELEEVEALSEKLEAIEHKTIDSRQEVFDKFAAYIIKGNILRGNVYPLCVGAERVVQAQKLVEYASELGTNYVSHGCTGAGNDQVRFDMALRCMNPSVKIIAPVRQLEFSREQEASFLKEKGFHFPLETKRYSINRGILGTTIGGGETHDSWQSLPEEAYVITNSPGSAPDIPEEIVLQFENGLPKALNSQQLAGYAILELLNGVGGNHGVGRGMHLGDTILGIKGRVAFEAPGAAILIAAHRELDKLVLTKWQMNIKEHLAQQYGSMLHEGLWFDPVMRDIECFLDSTQCNVTGEVRVLLHKGLLRVLGCRSPHSLMSEGAVYGEESRLWSGKEAEGFCKIHGLQSVLAAAKRRDANG